LIVAKALRTIDRSQDLGLKMLKQPTHKQMDYYYSKLLGEDWQKQLEQDFIDAVAEVDGGYITDDMVRGSSRNKQRCQAYPGAVCTAAASAGKSNGLVAAVLVMAQRPRALPVCTSC
jgi:hypothetical protein